MWMGNIKIYEVALMGWAKIQFNYSSLKGC